MKMKMKIKKLLLLMLLLIATFAKAQNTVELTEDAKVIVFTCTKGPELYAGFGHSAIWIVDKQTGVDRLFNYGTFDFDTPNFYSKFVRGRLLYMLSVTKGNRFLAEYEQRQLGVTAQNLNLTLAQVQKIYDFLENNYKPENRFYKYDFFNDNCATRIRDVIFNEVGSDVKLNMANSGKSYREMLFPYLVHTPWTKFGINMILGLAADKEASSWDAMYLPEMMLEALNKSTISLPVGEMVPLVKDQTKYLDLAIVFSNNKADDPVAVFGLILFILLLLSLWEKKKRKHIKWINNLLFSISVLAGLFLLFMWFGTDHSATKLNLNVFWLLPAQLLFIISGFTKLQTQKRLIYISLIYQICISAAMFIWPQNAEISFLLISLSYSIRMFFRILSLNAEPKIK